MKKMGMKMMVVAASAVWAMVGTPASALASDGWQFSAASGVSVRCTITDEMLVGETPSFVATGVTRFDSKLSGRYESASGDQSTILVTSFNQSDTDTFRSGRVLSASIQNGLIERLSGSDDPLRKCWTIRASNVDLPADETFVSES